ncbi:nonribosomal peptide synthetase MxaA, partial [Bradyrhizobium sp. Arg816]|nr:nonribosomal peptide synthetase MxaA [Bradyrhizobium sp. Arg816]
ARDRAWWLFAKRPARPFSAALRGLKAVRGRGDDEGYRQTLLALHRGLDGTDGRRVLADDLPGFLDRHPAFRAQGEALARFFSASRRAFFGRQTAAARESWPFAEAEATLRRLAAAERTA